MKFRTIYNHDEYDDRRTIITGVSLAIPHQAMSIREIMTRFVNGQPVNASQRQEIWDGEEYYPDPRTMDLAELEQIKEQYKAEIEEIESRQTKLKEDQKVLEKIPTEDPQRSDPQPGQPS